MTFGSHRSLRQNSYLSLLSLGFICFVLSSQSYLSEGEKKDSFASSLFLYEKENIEIVLTGVQLKKKCIDFRAMSDKILTRKNKRTDFQEGK